MWFGVQYLRGLGRDGIGSLPPSFQALAIGSPSAFLLTDATKFSSAESSSCVTTLTRFHAEPAGLPDTEASTDIFLGEKALLPPLSGPTLAQQLVSEWPNFRQRGYFASLR